MTIIPNHSHSFDACEVNILEINVHEEQEQNMAIVVTSLGIHRAVEQSMHGELCTDLVLV